jgi:hypothetical protein
MRNQAPGQRRLGRRRLPHGIRCLRLLRLRRPVRPGPELVHGRGHFAVVADHRRLLRAGRRRPRRQLPVAHLVRAPEPGLRRDHRRQRLVRGRRRRAVPRPEFLRGRRAGLRLHRPPGPSPRATGPATPSSDTTAQPASARPTGAPCSTRRDRRSTSSGALSSPGRRREPGVASLASQSGRVCKVW